MRDLSNLSDLGILLMGVSNKELNNTKNIFAMLEDK